MKKITEVTRRDIFSLFKDGLDIVVFLDEERVIYKYYGRLDEIDFLKKIYNLKALPSYDSRFKNAEEDIVQHTINNSDYEDGWVFEDERFGLLNGEDEVLLKFLCTVFHPVVRYEKGYWKEFLDSINKLLRNDGYELYPESKISGRDIYGWRVYDPEKQATFFPYSQRNEKAIKAKQIDLHLNKKIRVQVYQLLQAYSSIYQESDGTGWHYDISTEECVFRDISQFYKPKCFDAHGNYVETSDMEQFIMNNSPFCVFDAIELYEKYNHDNDFALKVNALFKRNLVAYKMEQGQLQSTMELSIDKKDIAVIPEKGLKELVNEAQEYYRSGNKKIAVETLWDAFERLKTYYSPALDKKKSVSKIIEDMSGSNENFQFVYKTEFETLTSIGNNFRIRHHEKSKIDITDNRQYDYFYKRCLALVSVAILYLERGKNV